jgi:ABC-type sugar transport system ATPase subunit
MYVAHGSRIPDAPRCRSVGRVATSLERPMVEKIEPFVELRAVVKRFGRTIAVDRADLAIYAGDVIGLIGGNGSGKSTLAHILAGNSAPEGGDILVRGVPTRFAHPKEAISIGISLVPQFSEIFAHLSVAENIFVGQELTCLGGRTSIMSRRSMHKSAAALLRSVGAPQVPLDVAAGRLSGGQQKAVSLARMLARKPKVVAFDEPNASLGLEQQRTTLGLIRQMAADGCAIVLITHDIMEIESVCDRVVAMERGKIKHDSARSSIDRDQIVRLMMQT